MSPFGVVLKWQIYTIFFQQTRFYEKKVDATDTIS